MPAPVVFLEFRAAWLPHVSNAGLERLVHLLDTASPMLIHGAFTRAVPMGCIASHIAWNHPRTSHLHTEAGVTWLTRVARLNPALSNVIQAWDHAGLNDVELRNGLLSECRAEVRRRGEYQECLGGEHTLVG